jgi:hypothetical protein
VLLAGSQGVLGKTCGNKYGKMRGSPLAFMAIVTQFVAQQRMGVLCPLIASGIADVEQLVLTFKCQAIPKTL